MGNPQVTMVVSRLSHGLTWMIWGYPMGVPWWKPPCIQLPWTPVFLHHLHFYWFIGEFTPVTNGTLSSLPQIYHLTKLTVFMGYHQAFTRGFAAWAIAAFASAACSAMRAPSSSVWEFSSASWRGTFVSIAGMGISSEVITMEYPLVVIYGNHSGI